MKNLALFCRVFFAIALIGFGIQHCIVQRFTIGEPSLWSAFIPGGFIWAYISGAFLIITGIMLLLNKSAASLLAITGLMIFLWAFVRDIPAFIMHPAYDASLTRLGEALAMTGSVFTVANSLPGEGASFGKRFIRVGPVLVGVFLFICGTQHFTLAKYVKTLVPSYLPGSLYWTYFAGAALIAGGLGLVWYRMRKVAALWSGIMIFIWMLIIHGPRVVQHMHDTGEWNSLLQTAALSSALFILALKTTKKVA